MQDNCWYNIGDTVPDQVTPVTLAIDFDTKEDKLLNLQSNKLAINIGPFKINPVAIPIQILVVLLKQKQLVMLVMVLSIILHVIRSYGELITLDQKVHSIVGMAKSGRIQQNRLE
ncbi:MAG: hypothetical protein EZS28_013531 [Streblomastix strix]|uniref:Uncharacterized protein n=1 Tax=Streblomastix strix TaxID=222440 RepID=A0A5J4W8K4_9EUKA|nr:MAG: hypothetical protein EZS28_013531 [Streblomastix strix]